MAHSLTKKQVAGVVETLTEIRKLFGTKGQHWIKGQETDDYGGFCLLGARREVDGRYEGLANDLLALAVARRQADEETARGSSFKYVDLNDNENTTFEDIKALISRAKKLAKSGRVKIDSAYIYIEK